MIGIIEEALQRTFHDIFGGELKRDSHPIKLGYVSQIPITHQQQTSYVHFIFKKELLVDVSSILLMDDHPDEDTLQDLTKELANLVVGCAKVMVSDKKESVDMGTPTFISHTKFDGRYDLRRSYQFQNHRMTLTIGSMDG